MRKQCFGIAIVLLLGISSSAAADPVIRKGIDIFTTVAGGKTYYDFAKNPVPAGFLCDSSPAYRERVALKGLPIETQVPGQLRNIDTIVQRLDDAPFNEEGVAWTRLQFSALSLVSVAPIQTPCGAFHVYISLSGKQPVTKMRIERTHENGGTFRGPLSAAVRLTFVPVKGRSTRKLELQGSVRFPGKAIPWSFGAGPSLKQINSVVVDTNGDLKPDTRLPGTSNFTLASAEKIQAITNGSCQCEWVCHSADGEQHCFTQIPWGCDICTFD